MIINTGNKILKLQALKVNKYHTMKKHILLSLIQLVIIAAPRLSAQSQLALSDKSGLVSSEVEAFLKDRFQTDGIELTSMVDFRKKCDYWFVTTYTQNNELILSVHDCHDHQAGTKNLGSMVLKAADSEKALLIYFAVSEILKEPGKALPVAKAPLAETVPADQASERTMEGTDPGIHKTRYFFSPSSFNLEEGELYYNTLYFFIHDVQYGINDAFSIGMGTTIAGWPFYLTPKISFPVNDLSTFAIGDLLMIGTWGTNFFGNLLYGTYTRGTERNNITIGGGHLFISDGDLTSKTHTPVLNLSGLVELSDHIYFITENYISQVSVKQTAYRKSDYMSETYSQNMFLIFGMSGFRFINRKQDVKSWQLGLTYVFNSYGPVPTKYNTLQWDIMQPSESNFMTVPVIGYTRKFGVKY